jgi:hypothetical protein
MYIIYFVVLLFEKLKINIDQRKYEKMVFCNIFFSGLNKSVEIMQIYMIII